MSIGVPQPSTSSYRDYPDSGSDDEHDGLEFQEASSDFKDENGNDSDSSDGDDDDHDESWFDPSELADLIEQATSHKVAGNARFTAQRNNAAMEAYKEGLACLPLRKEAKKEIRGKGKGKARMVLAEADAVDSDDEESARADTPENGANDEKQIRELKDDEDEKHFVEQGKISEEEKQVIELRSTLWGNVSACQMRLSLYKEAVDSATQALKDNPTYVKALQRRATANEKLQTWSSLGAALEDYTNLSKLPSTPSSLQPNIRLAMRTLPAQIEEKKALETKEMMDKLKGIGNSLLGKFGLSTDNFQFVKNDETGGYSMNFNQNAPKKN